MKTILLFTLLIIADMAYTQTEPVDYFGQTPPGDSAIIFAPGIISLADRAESGVIFSSDGKEFYFTVLDSTDYTNKLYFSRYEEMMWTDPVYTSFLEDYDPWVLFFSADNKKIYFTNLIFGDNHIWVVERDTAEWGEPTKLPSPINSDYVEFGYSETTDGFIYFSSSRDNPITIDIWCINPSTGQAESLGTKVNSPSSDDNPIISPDGSYLIFQSSRQSDFLNLYICFNKGKNEWTSPVKPGPKINIPQPILLNPSLSPEGKYLFFCRTNDPDNNWDIYWVSTSFIPKLRKIAFAPQLANQIPDITITTDSILNYEIPENTFSCEYDIDTLKFTATLSNGETLPSWLDFNSQTRTLTGSPTDGGVIEVTITATNPDTVSASCTFNIVSSLTSVDQSEKHNIKIFPNPTKNTIYIQCPDLSEKKVYYSIVDLAGEKIQQEILNGKTIDVSRLSKGLYLLNMLIDGEAINEKIIIY